MCDGCDRHSRQHLRTVDKVLRQSQKETPRIKDLLHEKWKKPVVCLKDLPQLKIEYPSLRIYQETTESLKQRENNNKQKTECLHSVEKVTKHAIYIDQQ